MHFRFGVVAANTTACSPLATHRGEADGGCICIFFEFLPTRRLCSIDSNRSELRTIAGSSQSSCASEHIEQLFVCAHHHHNSEVTIRPCIALFFASIARRITKSWLPKHTRLLLSSSPCPNGFQNHCRIPLGSRRCGPSCRPMSKQTRRCGARAVPCSRSRCAKAFLM